MENDFHPFNASENAQKIFHPFSASENEDEIYDPVNQLKMHSEFHPTSENVVNFTICMRQKILHEFRPFNVLENTQ